MPGPSLSAFSRPSAYRLSPLADIKPLDGNNFTLGGWIGQRPIGSLPLNI
jgi:hypothetical protein